MILVGRSLLADKPVHHRRHAVRPNLTTCRVEVTPQPLPAAIVIPIDVRRTQCRGCQARDVVRLKPARTMQVAPCDRKSHSVLRCACCSVLKCPCCLGDLGAICSQATRLMHGIECSQMSSRRGVTQQMCRCVEGKCSHMNARLSSGKRAGSDVVSGRTARSNVSVSGPCGVMHMCRLAPARQTWTVRLKPIVMRDCCICNRGLH